MSFPEIISAEMQIRDEPLPDRLDTPLLDNATIQLRADSFLFTTPAGTRFHYLKGRGIAIEKAAGSSPEETDLFYNGTVYGAVAWINRLIPLHASSVVRDGRVLAFTGESGEGKSTLAAALARHGYEHRSDDVLLIELRDDAAYAWPDRERIKLCDDAFELTGAQRLAAIEPGADKFFADLGKNNESGLRTGKQNPLPLHDLIFLVSKNAGSPVIEAITGYRKLPLILRSLYRIEIAIGLGDEMSHRATITRLARHLQCWTLLRKRDRETFEADAATISKLLSEI